ncbi:MAG: 5-formyltetrahydrofolate cyclo-ligase [Rhodobacteraceae bacterium]|jgi:5,10-methenyltetrahydrofolate synthetase|nr:5-formyltetrahydrofolate cyclo-ligase [Paracoccaceae bacterium]
MAESGEGGGSAPCFAHELVAGHPVDAATWRDVARFRNAERRRLYAARRALPVAESRRQAEAVMAGLDRLLEAAPGLVVSAYWPIRGEPDLRPWMERADRAGAAVLLPVVIARDAPLVFRRWRPGSVMERGAWNIPVPAGGEELAPIAAIAPAVGLDRAGFCLGNGGGYFDRTLAALASMPLRIGVGHDFCRIATIFPMPWDIPMEAAAFGDGGTQRFAG